MSAKICSSYVKGTLNCVNAFPGFSRGVLEQNLYSTFLEEGQAIASEPEADWEHEVFQDAKTSFFVLLAIYFPAVTGIMTG